MMDWPQPPASTDVILTATLALPPVGKGRPRVTAAEYVQAGGKRVRTRKAHAYTPRSTVEYQEHAGWLLRQAGAVRNDIDDLGIHAAFRVGNRQRKDIDNLLKALLDACNGIVWRDDAQVVTVTTTLTRAAEVPGTDLTVYVVNRRRRGCLTCGKALTVKQISLGNVYCSPKCYDVVQRKGAYRVCHGCGVQVYRQAGKADAQQVFCTPECRDKRRNRCRACEKPTWASKAFCSTECSEGWHRARPLRSAVVGTCPDCGGPVSRGGARCRPCLHAAMRRGDAPTQPRKTDGFPINYEACPECGGAKRTTAKRCRECFLSSRKAIR